jgi:peptidoglycan/LPS O-acetylase OafA/YrhL
LSAPHSAPPVEESAWDTAVSTVGRDHFRPDIEGLRAVAILAVLAYHARIPILGGGFVGVDVFFVISGFLITGLLLRELRSSGTIDLGQFYGRRARRLLPAALVVIAVTLLVSRFLLTPVQFSEVAADGAAASLYVSNYRYAIIATDYFAVDVAPSPLLHYWSLGVEEQFYLFWPVLILLIGRAWSPRRLWPVIAVISIASLALSVAITGFQAPWAFYSLPTRAWQLGLGALIALGVLAVPARWPTVAATGIGALGGLLIGAAVVLIDDSTPYPGVAAVLPAAGAALLIMAGERPETLGARLLATSVPRWFGRISYSLYLWHWPILILGPLLIGRDGIRTRIALAILSVGVAALSTHFIESPFRSQLAARFGNLRTLGVSGALSLSIAVVALAVSGLFGPSTIGRPLPTMPPSGPNRPPLPQPVLTGPVPADLQPSLLEAHDDRGPLGPDDCQTTITESALRDCVYGNEASDTTVIVFGDSHGAMWMPAVQAIGEERDWRIVPLVKFGCPPVMVTVWHRSLERALPECDAWRQLALDRIAELKPEIVFVVTSRNHALADESGNLLTGGKAARWRAGMVDILRAVRERSERTILIGDNPHLLHGQLPCLETTSRIEDCLATRDELFNERNAAVERAAAQEAGAELVPTVDWICPDGTPEGTCALVMDHYLVFRDRGHLTATITTVLAPQLRWAIDHPQ